MKSIFLPTICVLTFTLFSAINAQTLQGNKTNPARFSPAYGELILRKVDVEAEVFDLRQKFTNDSLQVKSKFRELQIIRREMNALQRMKESAVPKLNETYSKILLQKISAEVKFFDLKDKFTNEYADVKTAGYRLQLLNEELKKWFK